jgi:CubicO group peptidase (beta-lactamase class C family)
MSRPRSFGVFSLASLMLAGGCARFARMSPAYLDRVEAPQPLARRVDSAMTALEKQGFSGTLLIAQGTHMVLYRGYGIADPATGAPATALTRYPLGAVANQFTAASILALEESGRLQGADRADQFDRALDPQLGGATVAELLTRIPEPIEYAGRSGLDAPAVFHPDAPVLAVPLEEQFRTEGMSYGALESIVGAVSGQSYQSFVRERVLRPSRMDRTIDASQATPRDQVAVGSSFGPESIVPAKGLVAPLSDLYRFHLALEANTVLDASGRTTMVTPGANGYAPGWVVGTTAGGAALLQHVGDSEGFQLWTAWLPESDTVILLGINSDIGWRNVASEMLLGLVAGNRGGPPQRTATR